MVTRQKITVRVETCVGCHTCELACAVAHSESEDLMAAVAAGERLGYRIYVESFKNRPIPVPCNHCEEAACIMACPTGAVNRKTEGGPVFLDADKCIGCGMCVQACPFGVIAISEVRKTAYKCDVCIRRIARGEQPACVSSCPTRSLFFGEINDGNRNKRQRMAEMMAQGAAGAEKELRG
ncbi:MAG: 4Fe-4S dicluster domain-containing protein [Spirochaetales bacterium]|nr:MAG: 4Fe-4S dicluster domain-containing protein [Spirochaetales bacterium]